MTGEVEKEGFATGREAINPFTKKPVPIWVANFVLIEYGTGAVMGVPGHDQRDFEFARKYGLPVTVVVRPEGGTAVRRHAQRAVRWRSGTLVNSGEFDGLPTDVALERMSAAAEERGIGERTVQYRLKDWGISRQRYWGTPIPVVYCDKYGMVPVPPDDLPVELPQRGGVQRARRLPAGADPGVREHHVSRMRRPRPPRDGHDGHVRRLVLVLLPVLRPEEHRPAVRSREGRLTGGRSISTAEASSTRSCT